MIFVTVGTHEQQFDRLLIYLDELKGANKIKDEIIMQIGFSTYIPQYCKWEKLIPYDEMLSNVTKARIVITHGGPASFILPLQMGKIPIVVPRKAKYGEHVNNHQVEFCEMVAREKRNIIFLDNLEDLENTIKNYEQIISNMTCDVTSNNKMFNEKLEMLVEKLFK